MILTRMEEEASASAATASQPNNANGRKVTSMSVLMLSLVVDLANSRWLSYFSAFLCFAMLWFDAFRAVHTRDRDREKMAKISRFRRDSKKCSCACAYDAA